MDERTNKSDGCPSESIRNERLRNDPCMELMGKPYTELSPVEQVSWLSGLSVEEINRLGGMPEAAMSDEIQHTQKPKCGLFAIYVPGHCVLPKGHEPAADHRSQYGVAFTRGLTLEEGGHE